jgi:hypothetical protein
MMDKPEGTMHTEYAVATSTMIDGEFDNVDTGREWSNRRGKGYTRAEAMEKIGTANINMQRRTGNPEAIGAILMTRRVEDWTPQS